MNRIVAVYGFHGQELILRPLVAALRAMGADVVELGHDPAHAHDWLHLHPEGDVAKHLRSADWTCVLASDYPYPMLREWADAPVVATRHSLAHRGNTWEPEQNEADALLTWSTWDEARLVAKGITSPLLLRSGCIYGPEPWRPSETPRVLWCPTWNREMRQDVVAIPQLARLASALRVVVRPHVATLWREPEMLRRCEAAGLEVDPCVRTLAEAVADCDVLVSDVSGAGLMPLLYEDGGPPVVHLQPPAGLLRHSRQYTADGPEWTFRERVGPCVVAPYLETVVRAVLVRDDYRERRVEARAEMFGDMPETGAPERAARMILEVFGADA